MSDLGPPSQQEYFQQEVSLEDALIKQVEYYFSRENLAKDTYLLSHMTAEGNVPLRLIAGFNLVRQLSEDYEFIVNTLRKSNALVVSESGEFIKSARKPQRNTIIIRDLPQDADEKEVMGLFQASGCPSVTSLRAEAGGNWFATFNSPEDALSALDFVSQQTFRGAPVHARIKNEPAVRSGEVTPTAFAAPYSAAPFLPYGYYPPYGYPPPPVGMHMVPPMQQPPRRAMGERGMRGDGSRDIRDGRDGRRRGKPRRDLASPGDVSGDAAARQHDFNLMAASFPPLQPVKPAHQVGYQKEYVKYTKDDMVRIVQSVTDVARPAELAAVDAPVVLEAPIQELQINKPMDAPPPLLETRGRSSSHGDAARKPTAAEVVAAAAAPGAVKSEARAEKQKQRSGGKSRGQGKPTTPTTAITTPVTNTTTPNPEAAVTPSTNATATTDSAPPVAPVPAPAPAGSGKTYAQIAAAVTSAPNSATNSSPASPPASPSKPQPPLSPQHPQSAPRSPKKPSRAMS